jgi:PBP1b-binding outer membrane lipoprotein LpoB
MKMDMRWALIALELVLSGCSVSSAVSSGHNTALDSVDLVTMTDQMARSLVAEPRVSEAYAKGGSLNVVCQPVENNLTGEILPTGQAEVFVARVRYQLSKHEPQKFTWVMNRDAFYRLRNKELDVDLGPAPERVQPAYALVARFSSLADENSKRRSAAYLCVYQLTSIRDGSVLWTDKYEVKKTAVKGMLD